MCRISPVRVAASSPERPGWWRRLWLARKSMRRAHTRERSQDGSYVVARRPEMQARSRREHPHAMQLWLGTDAASEGLYLQQYSALITYGVFRPRSYWIPGSYAPTLSENHDSFLRLLKNKGFKEEKMTQVGLYAIGTSTTLESNKSLGQMSVVALPHCIPIVC